MNPERHPNRARPIMTPTPEFRAEMRRWRKMGAKLPTADEMRQSIRDDAKRLLGPLYERVQRQRGLPKKSGRMC